jgi:hypothetical protein
MAFALTSFWADSVRYQGPGPYRAEQKLKFTITGTTADVDLDIGDFSGTFWTAAIADATYGDAAVTALEAVQKIVAQATNVSKVYTPELQARIQAAAASGTAYSLALQNFLPNYTFDAANGATAYTVQVDLQLLSGILPTALSVNLT